MCIDYLYIYDNIYMYTAYPKTPPCILNYEEFLYIWYSCFVISAVKGIKSAIRYWLNEGSNLSGGFSVNHYRLLTDSRNWISLKKCFNNYKLNAGGNLNIKENGKKED